LGTSETDPIQVDFLPDDEVGTPGRLGMTFAPGMWVGSVRGRWERDLAADMRALEEEYETDVLVSLMEDHEYRGYRIPELLERDRFGDIEILRFAIEDMGVPREAESERFEAFVQDVVLRLERGQNVVVHCPGAHRHARGLRARRALPPHVRRGDSRGARGEEGHRADDRTGGLRTLLRRDGPDSRKLGRYYGGRR
jgi:rhodanese-related sulfurtransferase